MLENPSEEFMENHYQKFGTSKEEVEKDVQQLRRWYQQQHHLPQSVTLTDFRLRCILMSHKFRMERAKQAIDNHFTIKVAFPHFFFDRDPLQPECNQILHRLEFGFSKHVTKDGYRVSFSRLDDKDGWQYQYSDLFHKLIFMIEETRSVFVGDSSIGDIMIWDAHHLTMAHLIKASTQLSLLKKMDMCSRNVYKTRVKAIHVLNPPPFIDTVLALCKTIVKGKIFSKVKIHNSLESLHQHVDKEFLPVEYGGENWYLKDLSAEWRKAVENNREWFREQEKLCVVDESKRLEKSSNKEISAGIEGSFRRLTVD